MPIDSIYVPPPYAPSPLVVTAFGAVGDGVTSDTAAFQAALNALPNFDAAWSSGGRPASGGVVLVPVPSDPTKGYLIDGLVTFPAAKAGSLRGADAMLPRIRLAGTGGFAVAPAQRPTAFEGLVFDCAGSSVPAITYQDQNRFHHTVKDCLFNQSTVPALSIGVGVVNLAVQRCFFSDCAGGVWVTGSVSDCIYVDYCTFVRGTDVDVSFAGFDCRVRWSDFESRNTANRDKPFIRLLNSSNRVEDCRILGDATTGFGSPTNSIVIGPSDGSLSNTALGNVLVTGNTFSRVEAPSATIANAWVRLACPLRNSKIDHNSEALDPFAAFVDDAYTALGGGTVPENHGDNTFENNTRYFLRTTPDFLYGGVGWQGQASGKDVLRKGAPERAGGNLLKDTHDFSTARWVRGAQLTVAKDAVGPDGVAASAHTFTKAAGGSAGCNSVPTAAILGTSLVASAYLKAGSLNRARLAIRDQTGNRWVTSTARTVALSDEWQRLDVVAPRCVAGNTFALYLFPGHSNDTATTGTILVYGPQLEEGSAPSAYHESPSNAVRAARPFQALNLGTRAIGYGAAAPLAGQYLVGDIVLNTAPASAGFIGWVCTVAGSPGTWRTWGVIS